MNYWNKYIIIILIYIMITNRQVKFEFLNRMKFIKGECAKALFARVKLEFIE